MTANKRMLTDWFFAPLKTSRKCGRCHAESMKERHGGTLCKIGRREHMVALQEKGDVFMNTLNVFWGIEDGGLRGDNLDGVDHMANGIHAELRKPSGEIIPANVTSWTLQTRTAEPEKINLFCICLLYTSPSPRDATLSRMPSSA